MYGNHDVFKMEWFKRLHDILTVIFTESIKQSLPFKCIELIIHIVLSNFAKLKISFIFPIFCNNNHQFRIISS